MSFPTSGDSSPIPAELTKGASLRLSFRASPEQVESDINCTILEVYAPTMSLVLRVAMCVDSRRDLPSEAIVKLYHRRFLTNMRHSYGRNAPWSLDSEQEYRRYLQDVATSACSPADFRAERYPYQWDDNPNRDYGEFEAFLEHEATVLCDSERAAYHRLSDLQGKSIPLLYGNATYRMNNPLFEGSAYHLAPPTEIIHGVIFEYISPVSFDNLIETWKEGRPHIPTTILASLCHQAVKLVDGLSDYDVLNEDIRLGNFLIRPSFLSSLNAGDLVHISTVDALVLIDFGHSRLRRSGETDEQWRAAKWREDETGAVGYTSANLIKRTVGPDIFKFERSMRWYRALEPDDPDYPHPLPCDT